jgi:phosphomevalonate kinase
MARKVIKEEDITPEQLLRLINSYQRFFQFAGSLESGIHAFHLSFDNFTDNEVKDIRRILECIADQFDADMSPIQKTASMDSIKDFAKSLSKSPKQELLFEFFRSLINITSDPDEDYCRPHRIC